VLLLFPVAGHLINLRRSKSSGNKAEKLRRKIVYYNAATANSILNWINFGFKPVFFLALSLALKWTCYGFLVKTKKPQDTYPHTQQRTKNRNRKTYIWADKWRKIIFSLFDACGVSNWVSQLDIFVFKNSIRRQPLHRCPYPIPCHFPSNNPTRTQLQKWKVGKLYCFSWADFWSCLNARQNCETKYLTYWFKNGTKVLRKTIANI